MTTTPLPENAPPAAPRTYPYVNGPHLILGPEIFTGDGDEVPQDVIAWRGATYRLIEEYHSSEKRPGQPGENERERAGLAGHDSSYVPPVAAPQPEPTATPQHTFDPGPDWREAHGGTVFPDGVPKLLLEQRGHPDRRWLYDPEANGPATGSVEGRDWIGSPDGTLVYWQKEAETARAALANERQRFDWLNDRANVLEDALSRVVTKAVPNGEDDDGFIAGYVMGTGAIHNAIKVLGDHGIHVRPGGLDARPATDPEDAA